ncbi:MAG: energy-coupling factor transporter transmembrane component T [Erysipelotrichaceae bacterium]
MSNDLFQYEEKDAYVYRLNGASKLICFLLLTFAIMLSFDIRFISLVILLSTTILLTSKMSFKKIKWLLFYALGYMLISFVLSFLFSPEEGVRIYGTRHEIFHLFGNYFVTQEQLLYQATKFLKYTCVIPVGILFFLTTNPSDLSSSLNKIKVNYKLAYSFALTLRYIPEVTREYHDISLAMQARGIDLSGKAKLKDRFKNIISILTPLIFSSLDKIEYISNAMDLRGFGKNKNRSWYSYKKFSRIDIISMIICLLIFVVGLYLTIFVNQSRFFNPFI